MFRAIGIRPVLTIGEYRGFVLQHYRRAIEDADHTLALMDVCRDHSPAKSGRSATSKYVLSFFFIEPKRLPGGARRNRCEESRRRDQPRIENDPRGLCR